ncbi:hypothetical protein GCM10027425_09140 [Alteromonas gracilis]
MTNQESGAPLLSVVEVAQQLSVSTMTVRRWIERGVLAGTRIGGVYRVHPDVVADLLRQSRTSKPVASR